MSLERLELDLALKLAFVENTLIKVEEYRQHLQENAQKVKDEIHEVVEKHVGSLRVRERQLVRQVEVVTALQTCLLGTQQAGLMHGKGALVATRDLLERCSPTDTSTLAKIKVDDMECLKNVQPVNHVSVQLDETALSSAVSEFGSVQLPDTITHHPSPVIPAKVEEYEDDEHDVLHKSVAGAASGPDSPLRITVQFPRLANHNWLAQQKEQNCSQTASPKALSGIGGQAKSQDITSWLSGLQLAGAQEDEDDVPTQSSIGSFDMVAMNSPVRTSDGSSIEIVSSHYDSEKDVCSTPGSAM
ncbi:uncharacterized protein LOC121867154 [Homarus americanus]|uniref:uncharacterized protein LOC121867154 n=1 Tax=Homarus americanus TaxID=6706 RepID=UPI001C4415DD|nr:uncharacterized protein LOC121867154 [Homarus americanus]